jgi:integrase
MPRRRGNGEGTITRRKDGRWEGRYTLHTGAGPKRKVLYGKTRAEVAEKLTKAMADRDGGLVIVSSNITVGEYLDRWLEDCVKPLVPQGKLEHSTYTLYSGIIRNHIKPHLGHSKLQSLNRMDVRRLYNEKGKELAPRSVDYIHVTLQKALLQAVRDDLIPRNVASGERACGRRSRSEEAKALSPTQVHSLLEAAQGMRNEALYVAAVHTGLRQGELLGLKWVDVDFEGRRLSVRRALKVTDHGLDFGPPKNQASRRSVPLSKTAVSALRTHRTRQNEERLRLGDLWQDRDLVFPNRLGNPLDHGNLYYRDYKPLLRSAGLGDKGFTFHSLRHTFATELFNQRKRPKIIQSLLGHSSITQTMDTYSHLLDDVDEDEVGGLDKAFG